MPELPEVETVRRTLAPVLVGRVVARVVLARPDVVAGRATPAALLRGCVVTEIRRRGKQLAMIGTPEKTVVRASRSDVAADPRVLVVHLGMTGQLLFLGQGVAPPRVDHVHCEWRVSDRDGSATGVLRFRDPRRFGGLFPFRSVGALLESWEALGPDAMDRLDAGGLQLRRLWAGSRAIKAALLDQRCLAGVGNIYADESLFRARIHPESPARSLTLRQKSRLIEAIHVTLREAIGAGGSTLRDYTDAKGERGGFQERHAAYGRGGLPCYTCGEPMVMIRVGQRATTFCPVCQRPSPRGKSGGPAVMHKDGQTEGHPRFRKPAAADKPSS